MSEINTTGRYEYKFDPYMNIPENYIPKERHVVPATSPNDLHFFVPSKAPFFGKSLVVRNLNTGETLRPEIDYKIGWRYASLSTSINLLTSSNEVYFAVSILNKDYLGVPLEIDYHTIGARYVLDEKDLATFLRNNQIDPLTTHWDSVENKPAQYATDPHLQSVEDFVGFDQLVAVHKEAYVNNNELFDQFMAALRTHTLDESNPHKVSLVSLGISHLKDTRAASKAQVIVGENDKYYISPKVFMDVLKELGILNSPSTCTLKGPTSVNRGAQVDWEVTNFDSFSNYTVSCVHGNFRITNGTMTGTISATAPLGALEVEIDVNGVKRTINLTVA